MWVLLDEFANLGKINDFSTILTLVRSYGIRVVPIIQSVQQLEHNYDKDEDTIVSNCAIYNYLGTNSVKTREDLVKRLGKTTITEENSSRNTGGKQGGGSLSDRGVGRELLTVDELAVIDAENKNSIVLMGGRPFFCEKFRTQKHPLFSRIGNDIKGSAGYANNRSIEEDYADIAETLPSTDIGDFASKIPIIGVLVQWINFLWSLPSIFMYNMIVMITAGIMLFSLGIRIIKLTIYQGFAPLFIAAGANQDTKRFCINFLASYILLSLQLVVMTVVYAMFRTSFAAYLASAASITTFSWKGFFTGGIFMIIYAVIMVKSDRLFDKVLH